MAAANEEGSDGTVRLSTARLDSASVSVDFSKNPQSPVVEWTRPHADTNIGFGILKNDNHGTITGKEKNTPKTTGALQLMKRALSVDPTQWDAWCSELEENYRQLQKKSDHVFQNTVVELVDNLGQPVGEYFLEFYEKGTNPDRNILAKIFHADILKTVHAYQDDSSSRSLYLDTTLLHKRIDKEQEVLSVSLVASPEFDAGHPVGYLTRDRETDLGALDIPADQMQTFFEGHRTLFVKIVIQRHVADQVFRLMNLDEATDENE
jgi:hypothetical protein